MALIDVLRAELLNVCPMCNTEGEVATDDYGNELYYKRCTNDNCDTLTFRRPKLYRDND